MASARLIRPLRLNSRRVGAVTFVRPLLNPSTSSNVTSALFRFPSPTTPSHVRYSSHSPMGTQSVSPRKKVTTTTLRNLYKNGEPITVLTAHDFPSGHVADAAGMDVIFVGDSLAMVALGMEDTSEVLLEEMLLHCRSVARAARSAFTVGHFLTVCAEKKKKKKRLTNNVKRSGIFPWDLMRFHQNRLCSRPSAS